MTVKERYNRSYSNYLAAVRRLEKRFDVTISRKGRVLTPRLRSIEALGHEREKLKQIRRELEIEQRKSDYKYKIKWQEIRDFVEDAEVFVWSPAYSKNKDRSSDPSGSAIVNRTAGNMIDLLDRAESETPSARDRIERLEAQYGSIEKVMNMLVKLIYAVYNSGNSGFAKWAGANAGAMWRMEWRNFEKVLLGTTETEE